ncbi:hypothetical protein IP90_00027 [Luteimonas cucumeris]|uniref:Uncharacterized protein n=1 Tax=Luteimonas cucumeris TaxID=985012 RepID=A0A562LDP6_9GAMM|nr:hypothetical protein IP90_00027 [Luteimonas cucumeris]
MPGARHYFRYPLHDDDFHALRQQRRLLGYYAAKPLYGRLGRLDRRGRVDRSAGLNGEVIALFVPSPARSWSQARLVHARMPAAQTRREDGRRNWPAIRATAEAAIRRELCVAAPIRT